MNVISKLEGMGLSWHLDQGESFILGGLRQLSVESRRYAVEIAKAHKPVILEEPRKRAGAFLAEPATAY